MKRELFCGLLAGTMLLPAKAQVSSTLSPYSQFGLGVLADQSQGFNRGMGGVGIGLRNGKYVNMQNPASYSSVDSLTMIFDAGVMGQITNLKEGGKKVNAKTGNFDYVVAGFRLLPKVGVSFGVVPYSNIGYNYYSADYIGSSASYTNERHEGDGGFSQVFLGAGWEFMKGFSVGFNVSYFWGKWEKTTSVISSDTYVNTLTKGYSTSVKSYKLDFGVQWQKQINKNDVLTLGATVGLGHGLNNTAEMLTANVDNQTGVITSDTIRLDKALSIPFSFGVGASVVHKRSLTLALDYRMQRWGSLDYPMFNPQNDHYELVGGQMKDRHQVALGADWIPSLTSRRFLSRVHYKAGISYATPYYKVQGQNGPSELCLSAGFGIPIINGWNNRSTLNISAQWVHASAKNLVTENTFRINIGLTFNERWFAKWKVD